MPSVPRSQRPATLKSSSNKRNPPGPLPSPSPTMEIMILSGRQWTVCGAVRLVFSTISSGSMTLWSFGERSSAVSIDVYAARALARNDQESARLALVVVAGATSVPAEVVQLVPDVWHGGELDHPRVSGGLRVHVNRSQVVRLLNPRPHVERYGVEHLLTLGLHRLLGRGVARPTMGVALVVHLVGVGHDAYSFLPLLCRG